jgi:hypothetical protein
MTRRNSHPGQTIVAIAFNLCILAFVGATFATSLGPLVA